MIMKARCFFIALTVLAVSMVACTREDGKDAAAEGQVLTFTAVHADSKDTKTALQADGTSIWWTPNELINVFYGAKYEGKFASGNSEPQATATFSGMLTVVTGSIESGEADSYLAVYPYDSANTCDGEGVTLTVPSTQTGVSGTFADNFFPAVAKSTSLDLAFYNVCGGACISVSQAGITEIIIKSADGTPVAGKVNVGFGSDGKPVVKSVIQGEDHLRLLAPDGGFVPGDLYYAAMLPGTHSQGILIGYNKADLSGATKVIGNSVTVHRAVFGRLHGLDNGLNFTIGGGLNIGQPQGSGTADDPYNVAAACTIANALAPGEGIDDVYTKGIVSSISKVYLSEGVVTYFIQDEGYAASLEAWKGYYLAGTKFTDANQLKVGDEVIIKGRLELYNNIQPEYAKRNKIVWLNGVKEYDAYPSSPSTLNEALTLAENSHITLDGVTVVAKSAMGFVVSNGEHNLHVFDSDYKKVNIGDVVALDGIMIMYSGVPEMVSATASVASSGNPLPRTALVDITGSLDAFTATESDYISVTGTMTREDDYFNVVVDGASHICSITNTPSGLDLYGFVGKKVTLKGYYCNPDASRNAHMIIYSSVEECSAPTAVDLGLSVKWASCNVGATKPEGYGDYFAWGETKSKNEYSWSNYKFELGIDEYGPFSKYVTDSRYGTLDNKIVLDNEDDVARVNWGGNWRMPQDADWTELQNNCTWIWTDNFNGTGIAGRIVTSNKPGYEGNFIFLPAAGYRNGTDLEDVGSCGWYWASSLYTDEPCIAWHVGFIYNVIGADEGLRYLGFSVRPVEGSMVPVSGIKVQASLNLFVGETATLQATVSPSNATYRSVSWISSDKSVASVDYTGKVTALSAGTVTITVYTADSSCSATCEVTVKNPPSLSKPNSVKAVDLGLPSGLKWASCNVGATNPEEYGAYFAWGETKPKSDYQWSTYKWCNGDRYKLTKYCTKSQYWDSPSPMDEKTVLDSDDDAASANWGDNWRMPTKAEWTELKKNCTWTRTEQNGVKGGLATGPNGNSFFLPASGEWLTVNLLGVGSTCEYWSSSLATDDEPCKAWVITFYDYDIISMEYDIRCVGYPVRPVTN